VRLSGVVGVSPLFDHDLRLGQRVEGFDREHLFADAGGKGFHERLFSGRARLYLGSVGVGEAAPVSEGVPGQLGVVVHADEPQWSAARGHDSLERGDGAVGVDSPLDLDRERLPNVLVDDV
jgi:hypothetical protein